MTAKYSGSISTVAGEDVVLAGELLRARAPADVIHAWFKAMPQWQARGACVLWSTHWPRDVQSWPEGAADARVLLEANDAVARSRAGINDDANPSVLHDDGENAVAVLHCPGSGTPAAAVCVRLGELLDRQRMEESVARLEQAEKLQRSLYAIADMAGSDLEMPDMLRGLHRIVADLMYAENFYIALYDRDRDALRFLYFSDVVDDQLLAPEEEIPLARIERGLTWYLTRDKRPLMGATADLMQQVSGPLRLHGADSSDWLGVPMLRDGDVHGVVVVQSYTGDRCYTTAEMSLLAFVAEHILTALERKRGRAELERHVVERTQQLQVANSELRREVGERERGERLQAALYRIAALASLDETSDGFYRHVHAIVGELIDARNFYIGLLSEDGSTVSFPYAADEHERDWSARSYGRGLTEHVLRTQRPALVTRDEAATMVAAGEIDSGMLGAPTLVW